MASSLTETVKQTTADLAATIQNTDWASELASLKQGLDDEGAALAQSAKTAAERLPVLANHLPEKVGESAAVDRPDACLAAVSLD